MLVDAAVICQLHGLLFRLLAIESPVSVWISSFVAGDIFCPPKNNPQVITFVISDSSMQWVPIRWITFVISDSSMQWVPIRCQSDGEWVDWFNTRRLLEPLGYIPPAEYEKRYYERN